MASLITLLTEHENMGYNSKKQYASVTISEIPFRKFIQNKTIAIARSFSQPTIIGCDFPISARPIIHDKTSKG